jgi:hypothetical protein
LNAQLHVASWRGKKPITAAVAVTTALDGAFVAIGTEGCSSLGLD